MKSGPLGIVHVLGVTALLAMSFACMQAGYRYGPFPYQLHHWLLVASVGFVGAAVGVLANRNWLSLVVGFATAAGVFAAIWIVASAVRGS